MTQTATKPNAEVIMKAIVDRASLLAKLETLARIVPERAPAPMLESILIETAGKNIRIIGSDGDRSLSLTCEQVDIMAPGRVCVPLRRLIGLLRAIGSDHPAGRAVTLAAKDDAMTVGFAFGQATIVGQFASEFQIRQPVEAELEFQVPAEQLAKWLTLAVPLTAEAHSRYAIRGVKIDQEHIVATDRRGLVVINHGLVLPIPADRCIVIPRDDAALLSEMYQGAFGITLKVRIGKHFYEVEDDLGDTLRGTLELGDFPPWQDVIPRDSPSGFRVDADEFAHAVKVASSMTTMECPSIKLTLAPGRVELETRQSYVGQCALAVDVDKRGDEGWIAADTKFLLRAIEPLSGEIDIRFSAPNRPLTIEQGPVLHVLMPVKWT